MFASKTNNMLRHIFSLLLLLFLTINLNAQNASTDLIGTWNGWDKLIKIYEDEKGFQGIFVDKIGEQSQKEKVLIDLIYKNGSWKGKSYSKKRNKRTAIKCELISPTELKVKLDIGFIWMPFTWERVE